MDISCGFVEHFWSKKKMWKNLKSIIVQIHTTTIPLKSFFLYFSLYMFRSNRVWIRESNSIHIFFPLVTKIIENIMVDCLWKMLRIFILFSVIKWHGLNYKGYCSYYHNCKTRLDLPFLFFLPDWIAILYEL